MNNKIYNYFKLACDMAASGDKTRKFWLGAIGVRKDGALVKSCNSAAVMTNRMLHAEYRLQKKLDVGSIVYVARVSRTTGDICMARPCQNCQKALRTRGVKRVYFTISDNEFGWIDFSKQHEKIRSK